MINYKLLGIIVGVVLIFSGILDIIHQDPSTNTIISAIAMMGAINFFKEDLVK